MSDLLRLQQRILKFRDDRNWEQFHNPKDTAISLVLEATEFLEHFQWKTKEEFEKHYKAKHDDVADELIDVLYWVLLIAHDLDIDIEKEFNRKIKKNEAKYPLEKAINTHKKYTELEQE